MSRVGLFYDHGGRPVVGADSEYAARMGYVPPPPPAPPVNLRPTQRRPAVTQSPPIFFSRAARRKWEAGQAALPKVYADPRDAADMDAGPLPCSADDYAAVLSERGLVDVSLVTLRPRATPLSALPHIPVGFGGSGQSPRPAPTNNPGTR